MPELPEVQTVIDGLAPVLEGNTITDALLRREGLRFPFPPHFAASLKNATIERLTRRGKYILTHLDNEHIWLMHLGMSGRLLHHPTPPATYHTHDHVILNLSDGSVLVFNDARRFGIMTSFPKNTLATQPLLQHMGVEPLSDSFTPSALHTLLAKKQSSIKSALMDQRLIAGLGNIYVCESLFRANIHPERPAQRLTRKECAALVENIKAVLGEAITSGGSTLRDYVRSSGDIGYFQHRFFVYGRENQPCFVCSNPVKRMTQHGRSTFYCTQCQPQNIKKPKEHSKPKAAQAS